MPHAVTQSPCRNTQQPPVRQSYSNAEASPHGPSSSPYFCIGSRAVAGQRYRYEYGVQTVSFPKPELAEDGSTTIYRVVSYGGGGVVAGRANCMIPNSTAAKARIERLFRVPRSRDALPVPHGGGSVAIQSEPVPIEGVDVYTCRYGGEYPHCNYEPAWIGMGSMQCSAYDPSCGTGGGGDPYASDGWSWGSAGGDGSEPPPPDDGTGREPCRRDAAGFCITESVDSLEFAEIVERVNAMKELPAECARAKEFAQELVRQGRDRFQVWNGFDIYIGPEKGRQQRYGYNSSDQKGRILVFDSYWLFEDPLLVAHEALHNYLHRINSPLLGGANEDWVKAWAPRCA